MADTEFTLEEYARLYVSLKADEKKLKKDVDITNKRIKELMREQDVTQVDAGNNIVSWNISKRESLDEEKLLGLLKEHSPETNCIKTKEYIDMETLESEIYKGILSDKTMALLSACRVTKEVETLTISKKKETK